MATKIGDLFFDVSADVSKAVKSVDGLTDTFKSAGAAATRAIGETVANAAGIAVAGLTALTVKTLDAGAAYNVLGQSATAAFTTIYDSAYAAQGLLSQISELNLETPFRGSAIARTARTLAGFGVALEDNVRLTEALAEATAAMGLGSDALNRIAIAFGQIQSRGKLAGDEARQLANYGIDAYGLLAEKLGMTVAEVRELGQASKLTADFVIPSLIEAIEERFGGATERLFNTAAGQAEGLRSVMEAVGAALVEPFIGFAGGGVIVDVMSAVRLELVDLVSVAEDGSFVLRGFLEPLAPIMEDIADSVGGAGESFANMLGNIPDMALADLMVELAGLGPLIAGVGAALSVVFAQSIPVLGRLVAGLNPIVVGVLALISASSELRATFGGALREITRAAEPLIPQVQELLRGIVQLAEDAGPAVADILVTAFEILVPLLGATLDAANELLPVLGPLLVDALEATAVILGEIADLLDIVGPEFVLVTGGVIALAKAFPLLVVALQLATVQIGATGTAATIANSAFLTLATSIGIALAALGGFRAASAGLSGDINYLNEDVPFYEKPFQLAGRFGYALGGGDREAQAFANDMEAAETAAAQFNLTLLDGIDTFGEARAQALQWANSMGVSADAADHFANIVALAWDRRREDLAEEQRESLNVASAYRRQAQDYLEFLNARAQEASGGFNPEEEIDLLDQLKQSADAAWEAVDRLMRADAGATLDDFLRDLPGLAEDLTDALSKDGGVLRNLEISGTLEEVRSKAVAVIRSLAKDYGMSMDEIRALFDRRGLAAVIEELGRLTEETTETIDPLILKYSELNASVSELQDAIDRLEDQRTTALKAQIDQVSAALDDARRAADEAREAFDRYFQGTSGGVQGAIDKLVLDVPNIGDQIEKGLLQGGPQGEALVRQALGQAGTGLADVFRLGLEQGLSAEQITGMLGPVYGSIQQEVAGAMGRIQSQDWTAGFTPQAAAEIQAWMAGILDPAAISEVFNNIAGADARVSGLQAQLKSLQAQLNVEVEFTPEQVQAALDEIKQTQVTVTPTTTPEAAQAVYDAIQEVLNDEDLEAAVDQARITQDILDAAQAAEDQVNMVFDAALSFNNDELHRIARMVGAEFYAAFQAQIEELNNERARQYGFESYSQMQSALGPAVAGAIIGGTTITQSIEAPITVNGAQAPEQTASTIVTELGAAAGSGGQLAPKYIVPPGLRTPVPSNVR